MEISAKVEGLDEAMDALRATMPAKEQKKIITKSLSKSSKETMLAQVKQRALAGPTGKPKSGALSESIGVRPQSRRKIMTKRNVAGVEITPLRSNLKAMAMYIDYYYTRKGRTPAVGMMLSGIRHGHLVEFGTVRHGPKSFLYDGARPRLSAFMQRLAADMRHTMEQRVRRARGGKNSATGRLGR